MRIVITSLLSAALLAIPCSAALAQDIQTPAAKPAPAKKAATKKAADPVAAAKARCDAKSGEAKDRCLSDLQTRNGTTTVSAGQTAYIPPANRGGALVVRNSKDLPASTAAAQRSSQSLGQSKLPANQPTDVAKAAAEAKRNAGQ